MSKLRFIAAAAAGLAAASLTQAALGQPEGIHVIAATYGANCGVRHGNVTRELREVCEGRDHCDYTVDVNRLGDPAVGCRKNYIARWECPDGRMRTASAPPEAGYGAIIRLGCWRRDE